MATLSKKILIASALGLVSLAFAGGFAASSATASPAPAAPIVNVTAWQEEAPAMPVELVNAANTPTCNPWDVSEAAMEEILLEMQRRGWRPPRQGDAVASLASFGIEGIDAVDPYSPMPRRGGYYRSGDAGQVSATPEAEGVELQTTDGAGASLDPILVEQVPIAAPTQDSF